MTMRRSLSFSLLIFSLFHVTDATEEINRDRFIELMQSDRGGMIKLYQPWCGHSTRMKPDWDMLAQHYAEDPSIFILDVNCEKEEQLCENFHPGGTYPTILVFPRGDGHRPPPQLYEGGRGLDDLKKFVDKELVRPCEIRSLEDTCNAKARAYVAKWIVTSREAKLGEFARLKSMKSEMTYDLAKWVQDRINLLQQMIDEQEQQEMVDEQEDKAVKENEL